MWYSTKRIKNGCYFLRKLNCHLRNVQESCWIIHCYVQKKSFLTLVYRRRYGRNGIHWSWIKHEWLGVWILIILRCNCWRREWGWWRRRWSLILYINFKNGNVTYWPWWTYIFIQTNKNERNNSLAELLNKCRSHLCRTITIYIQWSK